MDARAQFLPRQLLTLLERSVLTFEVDHNVESLNTQPSTSGVSGPMVLIIEDDPDIAELLRYGLENEQFTTRVALTGEEGLKASLDETRQPTVILLDLLLPGMNGFEICRRLRGESLTRMTPIIILTAKAFEIDMAKSLSLGANDYITKPFSLREVICRIRALLPAINSA
jgi:DNA-binding response OmpR family regulator